MRRKNIKTIGIIIDKKHNIKNDQYITLFTKDFGKILVIAKGTRSIKSKRNMHLDLFNLIKVDIYNKYNYYLLTQIESHNQYKNIKIDPQKTEIGYTIIEILNKMTPYEEKNLRLFNLTSDYLSKLNQLNNKHNINIINSYLINILEISGFFILVPNKFDTYLKTIKKFETYDIKEDFNTQSRIKNYLISEIEKIIEDKIKSPLVYQNLKGYLY